MDWVWNTNIRDLLFSWSSFAFLRDLWTNTVWCHCFEEYCLCQVDLLILWGRWMWHNFSCRSYDTTAPFSRRCLARKKYSVYLIYFNGKQTKNANSNQVIIYRDSPTNLWQAKFRLFISIPVFESVPLFWFPTKHLSSRIQSILLYDQKNYINTLQWPMFPLSKRSCGVTRMTSAIVWQRLTSRSHESTSMP